MGGWFKKYLLPGFVFQSATIGGAYGTGAELKEFFMPFGTMGGLMAMLVSTLLFSVLLAIAYEISRRARAYDYLSFSRSLLGKAAPIYEVLYILVMLLILSVVGAAAGTIAQDTFGVPDYSGTIIIMVAIGILVFYGTETIEKFFAAWSLVLYAAYMIFLGWNLSQNGGEIAHAFGEATVNEGWALSGLKYAGYNVALLPVLLFSIRNLESRKETIWAGLFAGPIVMIPAILFFFAMIGHYDELMAPDMKEVPVTYLLAQLEGAGFFRYLFPIVLFGTFIETGTAMIHGVNERVAHFYTDKGKEMPQQLRPILAIAILFTAIVLANMLGLINLIGQGYGTITYGFIAILVIPLLTLGLMRVMKPE